MRRKTTSKKNYGDGSSADKKKTEREKKKAEKEKWNHLLRLGEIDVNSEKFKKLSASEQNIRRAS